MCRVSLARAGVATVALGVTLAATPAAEAAGRPAVAAPASAEPSPGEGPDVAVGPWEPPVTAPVVQRFRPGRGRFEAGGHAGLDYPVPEGSTVRAAGSGVVAFAGGVAGTPYVVVAHGSGLRTSYAPVVPRVRPGERVELGTTLGTTGGPAPAGHAPPVLHFGLRVHGEPRDPSLLFAAPDLTALVALAPLDGAAASGDAPPEVDRPPPFRRWWGEGALPWWMSGDEPGGNDGLGRLGRLAAGMVRRVAGAAVDRASELRHRAAALWDGLEASLASWRSLAARRGADAAASLLEAAGRWGVRAAVFGAAVSAGVDPVTASHLAVAAQELLWEVGRGVRDWWRLRRRCASRPLAPAGTAPVTPAAERHLFAVGGAGSSTRPDGTTFDLPAGDLGYGPDDVTWFSYAGDGGPYTRSDAHEAPSVSAGRLARRVAAFRRDHPGQVVDLVGHSLGGVVVESFLKDHYARDPRRYPPIGSVVTVAAPHRGSALATHTRALATDPTLAPAGRILTRLFPDLPPGDSGASREIAEHAPFVRRLARLPLPDGVDMTTIGAVDDVVVTADRTTVAGARRVVVDPRGLADHAAVLTDAGALDSVRRALERAAPRCRSLLQAVRFRVEPRVIHTVLASPDLVAGAVRRFVARPST